MAKANGATRNNALGGVKYNDTPQYDHNQSISYQEALEHVVDITGASIDKSKKMLNALWEYTGGGFMERDVIKNAKALEDFIKAAPKWAGDDIYRGTRTDYSNKNIGDIIQRENGNVSSWSTDKFTAFGVGESEGTVLIVRNPYNIRATSVKFASSAPNEQEVLMSGKQKLKIVDKYKELGVNVIEAEPV